MIFLHYIYYVGRKRLAREYNDCAKVQPSPAFSLSVIHRQAIELFHTKNIAAAIRGLWRKSISNVERRNKKKYQSPITVFSQKLVTFTFVNNTFHLEEATLQLLF